MNLPDLFYEKQIKEKGCQIVAGADEVGRGAFAGPLVTGVVVFSPNINFPRKNSKVKINDSKKLTQKQREIADIWIRKNALFYGIGEASVKEINMNGLTKSLNSGFRRAIYSAVSSSSTRIDYLLIDAIKIPYIRGIPCNRQKAIIRGDGLSFSIAAASIIAKVYRDKLMVNLGKNVEFRKYYWIKNKGYGTKAHRNAILRHGTCKHHREAFVKTFLSKTTYSFSLPKNLSV